MTDKLSDVWTIARRINERGTAMDERAIHDARTDVAVARNELKRKLEVLERLWVSRGGQAGASLYQREPNGAMDPEGCCACRGTGRK